MLKLKDKDSFSDRVEKIIPPIGGSKLKKEMNVFWKYKDALNWFLPQYAMQSNAETPIILSLPEIIRLNLLESSCMKRVESYVLWENG